MDKFGELLKNPKELLDSIGDGLIDVIQFFPRVAENVAGVASGYASSVNRNLNEFKDKMPDEPAVIPRMVGNVAGETLGAGIGMFEAVVRAGSTTAASIKSQIDRGTR